MRLQKRVDAAAATTKTTAKTAIKTAMTTMTAVIDATTDGETARPPPTEGTTGTGTVTGREKGRERERNPVTDRSLTETPEGHSLRIHARDTKFVLLHGFSSLTPLIRSSHTPTSSARHDAPSPRDDFPPRFIDRPIRGDSRSHFDNRAPPNRILQHQRPMRPMGGLPMPMSMQGLLPAPNMMRPGVPAVAGMHPPAAILHAGPPMAHMLQLHQQQLREQEQHRMHQRMAASSRHTSNANQGSENALMMKQVPEYLMDTEKLTKFFKGFGKVVGINLQPPSSANVQMDSFESAAKAVESSSGLRMKLLGSKDVKILFANKEVFRTKFAAWQTAREEMRAKSLLPFNWAPPHLRTAVIAQSQTQFDKIKRIVDILSKPNVKVTSEKLQSSCDAVTKILKDLEKTLLLPSQGRENASDGIDVVCNRLQSRVSAVAEALTKIKPLSTTKLDLRSKSFRVLRISKPILDQALLESHFCNKKSLKAESVLLDLEAAEAVVSFFSRKDAEYAFVRGAQVSAGSASRSFFATIPHTVIVEWPSFGI
jgi:hypothetical protein